MPYIGADLGTSAVRLLLMDGSGRVHKVVSRGHPLCFPHPRWSEQNPEDWPTASMGGMKKLISECNKSQVAGINSGGQMHDLVAPDRADEITRPTIFWDNGWSEEGTDYLDQNAGKGKLFAHTANIVFTGFTVPKVPWMKKNEPENFARICRIMLPRNYLTYRLSGSFCTDYFGASDMLLPDVAHKHWSEEMMEMCGITRKQLSDLYESHQVVGSLKEELAKELGFARDVKIIAGAGNNAAIAVGTEIIGEGCRSISLGTNGTIFTSSEGFKVDYNDALHLFDYADGHPHLMGCMLNAVSCNRWQIEEIFKTKEFSREQEETVRLGGNHVFYLSYLVGERSPHNDPGARACFIGMIMDTSKEEMTRAVLEGVVFGLRNSLEVARSLGIRIDRTKICGGGAESPLWKKMMANVMNMKVDVAENEESPALGGAILAVVGCGEYPDVKTAADNIMKVIEATEPGADLVGRCEKQYGRLRQMYPVLKTIFRNPEE